MEKKTVIRFIARLNIGGPAIHTVLLSSKLPPPYETLLVTGEIEKDEGDMQYFAEEKGVMPVIIKNLARSISPLSDLNAILKFLTILKNNHPCIVHTHTAKAGFIGRISCIIMNLFFKIPFIKRFTGLKDRIRIVHTFHGHIFSGYFSPIKTQTFIMIERFLAMFTDKIIVLSPLQQQEICHKYKITSVDKTMILPLGFEFPDKKTISSGNLRATLPEDKRSKKIIALIGRMVPIKNHRFFIDGILQFYEDNPSKRGSVLWLIIGDGETRGEIQSIIDERGLKDDVMITGWIKDIYSIYPDIDVILLTSNNEGTPVSVIEALYFGRTVISTCVGGVPNLLSDNNVNIDDIPPGEFFKRERGLLIRLGDKQAFSRAVGNVLNQDLFTEDDKQKMTRWISERFGAARLVEDIKSLYDSLIVS